MNTTPSVPQMRAETGFGEEDLNTPFRVSGFVALILGLLSVAACFGAPLLVLPLADGFRCGCIVAY